MKLKALCLNLSLALAIPFGAAMQSAHADASLAVQQMAQIMLKMDKAPDNKQRETLQDLASNASSANEQRLAKGLLTYNGGLSDEGKQEVWAVLRQVSGTDAERELAKIINHFQSSANESDRNRLNALLSEPVKAEQKAAAKSDKAEKAAKKVEKKADKPAKKEEKK